MRNRIRGASMIRPRQVWSIIKDHVPKKQWVSSKDIYAIVESHGKLDAEDRKPQSPFLKTPKWKMLVRNVLLEWLKKGKIRLRKKQTGDDFP